MQRLRSLLDLSFLLLLASCSTNSGNFKFQHQPISCSTDSQCMASHVDSCTITNNNGVCTCGSNAACSGNTPYCNNGSCEPCSEHTQCKTQETDACVSGGQCVCGSTGNSCPSGQYCWNSKCVNCKTNSQCTGQSNTCNSSGNCVCGSSSNAKACSGTTPYCVNGTCKTCQNNEECTAQNSKTCNEGVCGCGDEAACSGMSDTCTNNKCVCGSSSSACSGNLTDRCTNGACICGETGKACSGGKSCINGQCGLNCGQMPTNGGGYICNIQTGKWECNGQVCSTEQGCGPGKNPPYNTLTCLSQQCDMSFGYCSNGLSCLDCGGSGSAYSCTTVCQGQR